MSETGGTRCGVCQSVKRADLPLCEHCYYVLPKELADGLMEPGGYEAAKEWLTQ